MEMWLTRSTLLLLTALVISGQVSVILDETLKEKGEKVAIGSSVIFKCHLKIDTNDRFWVKWYFNPSGSSFNETHLFCNKSAKPSTVVSNQTKPDQRDEELCCIKSNVTDKDSGWYFCKVTIDIPTLICKNSYGTEVNISQGTYNAPVTTPSDSQTSYCVSQRQLLAHRPLDVDPVWGIYFHPDCPAGPMCLAEKKMPQKQRRRSYLCKHSSCGQQTAFTSAGDAGGQPEGGFFFSKPPEPKSRQAIRRWQTEIQTLKKSWTSQPLFTFSHGLYL
ncbi:uncharacterized protein LOC144523640 isoform X1 [Sander vitreus]